MIEPIHCDDGCSLSPEETLNLLRIGLETDQPKAEKQWLCPFCRKDCWPGWDCECGAKAMTSVIWLDPDQPLMRSPSSEALDAFCFGCNRAQGTAEIADPIRAMIPESPGDGNPVPTNRGLLLLATLPMSDLGDSKEWAEVPPVVAKCGHRASIKYIESISRTEARCEICNYKFIV